MKNRNLLIEGYKMSYHTNRLNETDFFSDVITPLVALTFDIGLRNIDMDTLLP